MMISVMMRDRRVGRARGGVVAVETWYYCTEIGAGVWWDGVPRSIAWNWWSVSRIPPVFATCAPCDGCSWWRARIVWWCRSGAKWAIWSIGWSHLSSSLVFLLLFDVFLLLLVLLLLSDVLLLTMLMMLMMECWCPQTEEVFFESLRSCDSINQLMIGSCVGLFLWLLFFSEQNLS